MTSFSQASNIPMLKVVAEALEELLGRLVFVGGSTVEVMMTDPGYMGVRTTKDVDLIVSVATRLEYAELEAYLRACGHVPRTEDGDPICRWLIADTIVDLMPVKPEILGFSNRWYPSVMDNWFLVPISETLNIRVIAPPYFVATKIEAFLGRGNGDYFANHDIEDIIQILNGRPELVDEIKACPEDLKSYLAEHVGHFLEQEDFLDALPGCLPGDAASQARYPLILQRLRAIASLT